MATPLRYPGYERARREAAARSTVSMVETVRFAMEIDGRATTDVPQTPVGDTPPSGWCDEQLEGEVRGAMAALFDVASQGAKNYTLTKTNDGDSVVFSGYNIRLSAELRIHPVNVDGEQRYEVKATVSDGEAPEVPATAASPSSGASVLMTSQDLNHYNLHLMLKDARDRAQEFRRRNAAR